MQIALVKKRRRESGKGRGRGLAVTKMEMRFAIGPCNFSNLNLILGATRYRDAPSEPNLSRARSSSENVLRSTAGRERTELLQSSFCCSRIDALREYVARAIYVAA